MFCKTRQAKDQEGGWRSEERGAGQCGQAGPLHLHTLPSSKVENRGHCRVHCSLERLFSWTCTVYRSRNPEHCKLYTAIKWPPYQPKRSTEGNISCYRGNHFLHLGNDISMLTNAWKNCITFTHNIACNLCKKHRVANLDYDPYSQVPMKDQE